MTFEELGLAPEILRAVQDYGYQEPTPIQNQAIPVILSGRDLMGCAQTGTGKSAAFILPILHLLRLTTPGKLRALILVPTRELAIQVGRDIRELSVHMELRSTAVYGGVPIQPQEMMLRHGVDILVATPGRLKDHMWRGLIDFAETRFLVLDEADRMLDMGFIAAVREIVREIPRERTSMLFSATLEPEIIRLAKDMLKDPVRVQVARPSSAAEGIDHRIINVPAGGKRRALEELLRESGLERTLVFTRTRRGAHNLALHLTRNGHRVSSIHSDRSQSQRVAALEAFRHGKIDFLVATDIAARGLDVAGISHVINYDLPSTADDYVHRTGRTARAGCRGIAISLVAPEDTAVLRLIQQRIGLASSDASAERLSPELTRSLAPRRRRPVAREMLLGEHRSSTRPTRGMRDRRERNDRYNRPEAIEVPESRPRRIQPRQAASSARTQPVSSSRTQPVPPPRTQPQPVAAPRLGWLPSLLASLPRFSPAGPRSRG